MVSASASFLNGMNSYHDYQPKAVAGVGVICAVVGRPWKERGWGIGVC
jgi:hypothetical protein